MTKPNIITKEAFKVVGVQRLIPAQENATVQLWAEFFPRISQIKCRINQEHLYTICVYNPEVSMVEIMSEEVKLDIIACVQVYEFKDIPEGMVSRNIPAQKYAVFKSDNSQKSYEYIYGKWSQESGYELAEGDDFEVYDSRFPPHNSQDKHCDIYIPIK